MATNIDIEHVTGGVTSGTPLTTAPIAVAAGVEEVITFTNWPSPQTRTIDLITDGSDVTYGYEAGHTGGKLLLDQHNLIETAGGARTLYVNSEAGANLYIRIL